MLKRFTPFIAVLVVLAFAATADAAQRNRRKAEEPPPPPQFKVDGPTRTMSLERLASSLANGSNIGKFSRGCAIVDAIGGPPLVLHPEDAFAGVRMEDYANVFAAEAAAAGYTLPESMQGNLFADRNDARAELSIGAGITGLTVNGCFGQVLIVSLAEVEATISVDWQVFDPLEKKLLFRATNTGYAKLKSNQHSDTFVVEGTRAAFREAVRAILADPNFVAAVRSTNPTPVANGLLFNETSPQARTTQEIPRVPLRTGAFRDQIPDLRQQVVTVLIGGGHGSGFYIADGLVMTNQHVVAGTRNVKIRFFGGREIPGEVLMSDARRDIALIKAPGGGMVGLPLQLERPREGAPVYVIGSPMLEELAGSVTAGIVSAHRDHDEGPIIQSDVAIIGGNSGGPMFDENGNVVAVVVAGMVRNDTPVGLNYFIPIDDALRVLGVTFPGMQQAAAPGVQMASTGGREIQVSMYPAEGPLKMAGQTQALTGKAGGVGTAGTFAFSRPDGVTCDGRWTTLQSKPQTGSLIDKHRDVVGIAADPAGMVGGLAIGACSNGGSFQAEYYVVPGVDSGFGAATDSDGNVYKVIF